MDVSSGDRRAIFEKVVGKANAEGVNAAFESKLLLKDQQRGLQRWIEQTAGLSPKTKKDFIDKIQKMKDILEPAEEKAFLADIAAKKFGAHITVDEAKVISTGAKEIATLKEKWNADTQTWASETDRLAYGTKFVDYQDYVAALMRDANSKTFKEWLTQPNARVILDIANSIKGIVASLDNSFFGRQGFKVLATNPDIWARGFLKSWFDMRDSLMGRDPIAAIKADIFSRPNAMNGKYDNGKFALGKDFEEAFPTTLPEMIPGLGRLYKMSEAAFVGGALRFRADLADRLIPRAERAGVDMSSPGAQAEAIGDLINSMTGRGNIGRLSMLGEPINAAFFSIRFFKSNWDTLTAHTLGFGIEAGPARSFVRRQAALNLLSIIATMATILLIADTIDDDTVEWDPRSSNFAKIKIGNTRFDISGGMGSLAVLAARMATGSTKNTKGKVRSLTGGKFGSRNRLDVLEDFAEGKASPLAGKFLDWARGTDFAGEKLTYTGQALGLITPIGASTAYEAAQDPNAAPLLAVMMADALGFGASTYSSKRERRPAPREIWESEYWGGDDDGTQQQPEATQ
jgi:hypothetical protein